MRSEIEERARRNAEYIVKTGCTVRACADKLGASKSTVHKDVTERLEEVDVVLWEQVQKVLGINLRERHLRGGESTRKKYAKKK